MASSPLKELMEVEVVGSIMLNCMDIICQPKNAKKKKNQMEFVHQQSWT